MEEKDTFYDVETTSARDAKESGANLLRKAGRGALRFGRVFGKRSSASLGALLFKGGFKWNACALGVLFFLFLLAVSGAYDYLLEERGSAAMYSLNPEASNPARVEDGILKAGALREEQALMEAWYKYEACNSHRKCFVDDGGRIHFLKFKNSEEAGDFTMLRDYYEKENNFYLSPAFLKLCDELFHKDEFYYPEHLTEPVYAKVLPLKSDPKRKYITLLPLIDDGSERAKALKEGTMPYAVEEAEIPEEGEKRKALPKEATGTLLAESKSLNKGAMDSGKAVYTKGEAPEKGTRDYGLGSILQYEAMEKNSGIDCTFTSFDIHLHEKNEEGEESCKGTVVRIPVTETDTPGSLKEKITAFETKTKTVVQRPSDSILSTLCNHSGNRAIPMEIEEEDEHFVRGKFSDPAFQKVFGNTGKTHYPIKIPVIASAACFSGNIRYEYEEQETSRDLRVGTGEEGFFEELPRDSTSLSYSRSGENCAGVDLSCRRKGYVRTKEPSPAPKEIAVPVGLGYLESYVNRYQVCVPKGVPGDFNFLKRIHEKQEGKYEEGLDADGDGELTHLDFMINLGFLTTCGKKSYGSAEGGNYTPGGSPEEEEIYLENGLSPDAEGDVLLLAKVIASEAGPNKLDQLMVASVVMNRIYDGRFPNTMLSVLSAPGQYDSWTNGRINRMKPSPQMIASARQVIHGEFSIPSNVLFQKAGKEGMVYAVVVNGRGFFTHIYSIPRSDFQTAQTDRFGRTAPKAKDLRMLAKALEIKDQAGGVEGSAIPDGSPEETDEEAETATGPLYEREEFSLRKAMNSMQRITNPDRPPGALSRIGSFSADGIQSVAGEIKHLFLRFREIWKDEKETDTFFFYQSPISAEDGKNTVLEALTFLNRDSYSQVSRNVDLDGLQFFFLGKEGAVGMTTSEGIPGEHFVAGIDSRFPDFVSPTDLPLPVLSAWNQKSGFVHLSAPFQTKVLSVGEGCVERVTRNRTGDYCVELFYETEEGRVELCIDGLFKIKKQKGSPVTKGEVIGSAGKKGIHLSMTINKTNVDPMEYFYLGGRAEGAAFYNILGSSGYADPIKKERLLLALRKTADSASFQGGDTENALSYNRLDRYHAHFLSRYVGECTWWAYGRGRAYADSKGTGYAMHKGYGNGGDYFDRVQQYGDYKVGRKPRAGSWICWHRPGGYGHVAFVEAVERDGSIWISETYRKAWDRHDGKGILLRRIKGPDYRYSGKYHFRGFIYLDEPLDRK